MRARGVNCVTQCDVLLRSGHNLVATVHAQRHSCARVATFTRESYSRARNQPLMLKRSHVVSSTACSRPGVRKHTRRPPIGAISIAALSIAALSSRSRRPSKMRNSPPAAGRRGWENKVRPLDKDSRGCSRCHHHRTVDPAATHRHSRLRPSRSRPVRRPRCAPVRWAAGDRDRNTSPP